MLIVIKDTKLRYMDRLTELYNTVRSEVACDIFVYTEKELEEMQRTSSFVRRALREGKVLHAA